MDNNIHEGHRKRIVSRFLNNPNSLSEHEKLEVLLFAVVDRRDTNALAHTLINVFGGLDKVFEATPEQLMTIKGVGEKVATHICVVGKIFASLDRQAKKQRAECWLSFDCNKKLLPGYFPDKNDEKFVVFLLDKKYKKLSHMEFKTQSNFAVKVEVPELVQAIAVVKPRFILIAHNHPSGNVMPSEADDFTTKKLNILCDIHGISLVDHIILSGTQFFSYHAEGRMEQVRKTASVVNVLREVDKTPSID